MLSSFWLMAKNKRKKYLYQYKVYQMKCHTFIYRALATGGSEKSAPGIYIGIENTRMPLNEGGSGYNTILTRPHSIRSLIFMLLAPVMWYK